MNNSAENIFPKSTLCVKPKYKNIWLRERGYTKRRHLFKKGRTPEKRVTWLVIIVPRNLARNINVIMVVHLRLLNCLKILFPSHSIPLSQLQLFLKKSFESLIKMIRSFNKWEMTALFYEFNLTVRYCLMYSKSRPATQKSLPALDD
jgi:hypothetical protein